MRRLSYSQVSMFQRCPRKWYEQYILRTLTIPDPKMQYGKDVHKLLAQMWRFDVDEMSAKFHFEYMDDPDASRGLAVKLVKETLRFLRFVGIDYKFDQLEISN